MDLLWCNDNFQPCAIRSSRSSLKKRTDFGSFFTKLHEGCTAPLAHIINTSVFCNHGGIHVLLNRHIASIEPRCLSTEAPSCFFVVPKNKPWYGCNSSIVIYANEDSSAHYICIVTTMPVLPSFVSSREHWKMHTMTASHVDKSIGTG